MGTEIFLGFLLVSFYSIVEDGLIVGCWGSSSGGLGHIAHDGNVWGMMGGGEDFYTDGDSTDTQTRCRGLGLCGVLDMGR